jgi:hypothetical protein
MVSLVGCVIVFIGVFGFGISTNIYGDFLRVSEEANDAISLTAGISFAILTLIISLPIFH